MELLRTYKCTVSNKISLVLSKMAGVSVISDRPQALNIFCLKLRINYMYK